jgi:hypothetical protein
VAARPSDKPLASGNVWVWGVDGGIVPSAEGGASPDSLVPRLAAKLSGKGIKGLAFGDKAAAAVTNKVHSSRGADAALDRACLALA